MGIDIRDGSQLECINCALCIDACDEIMLKVGRPTGLIAFDTDAAVAAREQGRTPEYRLIRARTIYYAVALAVVSAVMLWGLLHHRVVEMRVMRDRNPMFVRLHDGSIRNGFTLKISNRTLKPQTFHIAFTGVAGAVLKTPGEPAGRGELVVPVDADAVRPVRVLVSAPQSALAGAMTPAAFRLTAPDVVETERTVFVSGAPQ